MSHPFQLHFLAASGQAVEWRGCAPRSRAYFCYPTLEAAITARDEAYANHDTGKRTNFKAPRGRLAVYYFDKYHPAPAKRVA